MNRPILKRRSDAQNIAKQFASSISKILGLERLIFGPAHQLYDNLGQYWYMQVKKHGWRRLSGKRIEELNVKR